MHKLRIIRALLFGGLLAFGGCSGPTISINGGSGTRTGNPCTVAGIALDLTGNPVPGAMVRLRAAEYLTPMPLSVAKARASFDALTDQSGAFELDSIDTGTYSLEINDLRGHAFRSILTVSDSDTLLDLGSDTLAAAASLSGSIPSSTLPGHRLFVQVYGMERIAAVDSLGGGYRFSDLPAGTYTLRIVAYDAPQSGFDITGVTVGAGDTLTIPPTSVWKFSRKLLLNTTATGAGVGTTIENFPALIRLRSTNFDFSQAQPDGADLLFTKPDGAVLPHEIERWDAAGSQAEIWVKLDTIYGNNANQSIRMHWGNALARASSSGEAVFDTADGFEAVLHLGAECKDATSWKSVVDDYGTVASEGVIGTGRYFSGNDSIRIAGLLNTPPSITLSAWARLDTVAAVGAELISLGDDLVIRLDDTSSQMGTKGSFRYDSTYYDWRALNTQRFLARTGWHLISYSVDGAAGVQSLYIDGERVAQDTQSGPIFYHTGRNTFIGAHAFAWDVSHGNFNFTGCIDEVRISRAVDSADWIMLCYMNQKEPDALVVFE